MPPGNLTKRHRLALKRANESKTNRLQDKEARRQRRVERAQRKGPPPRRRDWRAADAEDVASSRRPPPERRERRSTPTDDVAVEATVVEVRGGDSLVMSDGTLLSATLARSARLPEPGTRASLAVGDRVRIQAAGAVARVIEVLPRRSALVRDVYDPSRRGGAFAGQVLAANVDQVLVVTSAAEPPFRPRLIDRYLVAASRDGLPALVCLNKMDLGVSDEVARYVAAYGGLGVEVLGTSALTGEGLSVLRERLAGRVSLLSGHSGVGKSSLLNALEPALDLRVGDVTAARAGLGKGRHTTTSARLVPLSTPETFVVDTPGVRAFGIRGLPKRELAAHFGDIAALAQGCAYRDCLHDGEERCAVALACRGDRFLFERWGSYRSLLGELR